MLPPPTARERLVFGGALLASIALWLACFVALIPTSCTSSRVLPEVNPVVVREMDSVVRITGGGHLGTGWVVASMPSVENPGKYRVLVMTAGHVVSMGWPLEGEGIAHSPKFGIAIRKYRCQGYDMGILEFVADAPMPVIPLRPEPLRRGEHLWLVGFPLGLQAQVTQGYVGDPSEQEPSFIMDDGEPMREAAIVPVYLFGDPGNSGSAVFDDNGEAVGMLVLGWGGSHGACGIVSLADPTVSSWIKHVIELAPPYWLMPPRCGNEGH